MEKKFHIFVRRHGSTGCTVSVLALPHLSVFAEDFLSARNELARVLSNMLSRNVMNLTNADTFFNDVRSRRVDILVRGRQRHRLLPVPIRVTAVIHKQSHPRWGLRQMVRIPRLEVVEHVADLTDVDAFIEEMVRSELSTLDLEDILRYASDGDERVEQLVVTYKARVSSKTVQTDNDEEDETPAVLREAAVDLESERKAGVLARAFERGLESTRLANTVASARRASVLLVGPSGVGKTALVHELVHAIHEAKENNPLAKTRVFTTSGSRIIAGMMFLGMWQERVRSMLQAMRAHKAVLHIENLSELISVMSSSSGLDIPSFLLPAIETGEITVIAECTPTDLARIERTHSSFVRALRPMPVEPLTAVRLQRALISVAARVGRSSHTRVTPEAITRAHLHAEQFGEPGAVLGTFLSLLQTAVGAVRDKTPTTTKQKVVGASEVTDAFCVRTGYPREIVDPDKTLDPEAVLARLRTRVVGQDHATLLLRDLVVSMKSGLTDPKRPLGSFLLLGPTGVGKTESALAMAEYLFGDDKRLVRFDMSEYAAPGSAMRLVEVAAGSDATLARKVREQPFGVVLLDEIEKADRGVHDLLLQVLGEGRMTDSAGNTVSFRNTVVMLTSNLGADRAERTLGFGTASTAQRDMAMHYSAAAAEFFRPEMLNRFDHVVPYHALSAELIERIAKRMLDQALAREGVTRRGVVIEYAPEVVVWLARAGFDARHGARPLKRAIEREVIAPLARLLAARANHPPERVKIVASIAGIALVTNTVSSVVALDDTSVATRFAQLVAKGDASHTVQLGLRWNDPAGRRWALWLQEHYVALCTKHGGVVELESREREVVLQVRGGVALCLEREAGVCEWSDTSLLARVWVTVNGEARGVGVEALRAFTAVPVFAVRDMQTSVEVQGDWEAIATGVGLERLILGRAET